MELHRIDQNTLSLVLTEDQLRVFQNCMRQLLVNLHEKAFDSRIGVNFTTFSDFVEELSKLSSNEKLM
jgi:hypothetical protein